MRTWKDYNVDLKHRTWARERTVGLLAFVALIVVMALTGCERDSTYSPEVQNAQTLRPQPQLSVALSPATGNWGCSQLHVQFFATPNTGEEVQLVQGAIHNGVRLEKNCGAQSIAFATTIVWLAPQNKYQVDVYIPRATAIAAPTIDYVVGDDVYTKIRFSWWDDINLIYAERACDFIDTVMAPCGGGGGGFDEQSDSTLADYHWQPWKGRGVSPQQQDIAAYWLRWLYP